MTIKVIPYKPKTVTRTANKLPTSLFIDDRMRVVAYTVGSILCLDAVNIQTDDQTTVETVAQQAKATIRRLNQGAFRDGLWDVVP